MAVYDCVKGKSTTGGDITVSVGFTHEQSELRCLALSNVKDEYQWKIVDAGNLTQVSESVYRLAYPFSTAGQAWTLYIWRKTKRTDDVVFDGTRIPIEAIITKLIELSDKADETAHENERAVRTPECDGTAFLPPKDVRAGELMGFDEDGNPTIGKNTGGIKEIYEVRDAAKASADDAASYAEAAKASETAINDALAEAEEEGLVLVPDATSLTYGKVKLSTDEVIDAPNGLVGNNSDGQLAVPLATAENAGVIKLGDNAALDDVDTNAAPLRLTTGGQAGIALATLNSVGVVMLGSRFQPTNSAPYVVGIGASNNEGKVGQMAFNLAMEQSDGTAGCLKNRIKSGTVEDNNVVYEMYVEDATTAQRGVVRIASGIDDEDGESVPLTTTVKSSIEEMKDAIAATVAPFEIVDTDGNAAQTFTITSEAQTVELTVKRYLQMLVEPTLTTSVDWITFDEDAGTRFVNDGVLAFSVAANNSYNDERNGVITIQFARSETTVDVVQQAKEKTTTLTFTGDGTYEFDSASDYEITDVFVNNPWNTEERVAYLLENSVSTEGEVNGYLGITYSNCVLTDNGFSFTATQESKPAIEWTQYFSSTGIHTDTGFKAYKLVIPAATEAEGLFTVDVPDGITSIPAEGGTYRFTSTSNAFAVAPTQPYTWGDITVETGQLDTGEYYIDITFPAMTETIYRSSYVVFYLGAVFYPVFIQQVVS